MNKKILYTFTTIYAILTFIQIYSAIVALSFFNSAIKTHLWYVLIDQANLLTLGVLTVAVFTKVNILGELLPHYYKNIIAPKSLLIAIAAVTYVFHIAFFGFTALMAWVTTPVIAVCMSALLLIPYTIKIATFKYSTLYKAQQFSGIREAILGGFQYDETHIKIEYRWWSLWKEHLLLILSSGLAFVWLLPKQLGVYSEPLFKEEV